MGFKTDNTASLLSFTDTIKLTGCCLVTQSCLIPCDPMDCSTPGFPVLHYLPECAQIPVHCVDDAIQPSHPPSPLLLLPSVFPSIWILSNQFALHIRWPKYWNFSFSISPSNKCSGLISFRINWFDLPCSPGDSQESSPGRVKYLEWCYIASVDVCTVRCASQIQTFYPMIQLWLTIQVRPAHVQSIQLFVDLLYLWK